MACTRSNENKMSDGGRNRAPLGLKVWKSSQKWGIRRSAVRSIAWLDGRLGDSAKARLTFPQLIRERG